MKTALRVLNDLVAEKVIKDYAIGGAMGAMFYMEAVKDRLRVQMFLSSDGFDKKKFEDLLDKFGMSKEKSQWLQ